MENDLISKTLEIQIPNGIIQVQKMSPKRKELLYNSIVVIEEKRREWASEVVNYSLIQFFCYGPTGGNGFPEFVLIYILSQPNFSSIHVLNAVTLITEATRMGYPIRADLMLNYDGQGNLITLRTVMDTSLNTNKNKIHKYFFDAIEIAENLVKNTHELKTPNLTQAA
jgi:hypothetical protein